MAAGAARACVLVSELQRLAVRKIICQIRRMTDGVYEALPEQAAEIPSRGGEVYSRLWAFHGPPEMRPTDPRGGMARHPPPTRRGCGNLFVAMRRAERAMGSLKQNHSSRFAPFSGLRLRIFAPWHGAHDWVSCGANGSCGCPTRRSSGTGRRWRG
jgi:hypothetical protein